jgi:hypothetical protein
MIIIKIKYRTILIFLTLIINSNIYSQKVVDNITKCDLETIKNLRIHKDSLTDKLMTDFLFSIDNSCKNNVEWSEASNWTLFWLADIETKRFIDLLKSNQNELDIQLIVEEFKQPVNDGIDLIGIYKKIEKLNDKSELVIKILDSIKSAAKGLGLEIK